MAMSTMLYHENPPLRNEAPVDLATTSPMPGRNRKVSEVCWMKIYTRPYHNNKTQLPKISQLHLTPTICFINVSSQSLGSVLRRARVNAGVPEEALASPASCFAGRAELHYLSQLPTLLPTLILSSPYRLIQKVNTQTQKCLPLSPPTSPSPSAAPRSSLAMSTAPSPFPSLLSVT